MLPPPVQYPKRRRTKLVAGVVLAVVVIAAVVTAIVFAAGNDKPAGRGTLSDASAKAAIQEYLDALSKGDDETVARHTLCGLFDAVKERRSDLALASLSSDAFRKQYSRAEVTSIDKMVQWSPNQAQVLFTMKVAPASGSRGQSTRDEQQAVAQLLAQDDEVLVCSYLPRTAGQY
jgi:outer membrane PBP1 activator LpoA protein